MLAAHAAVRECVVVARGDGLGDALPVRLVAYVATGDAAPEVGELRAFVRRSLPEYMVPAFVVFEALPHLPSGKVDRGALPEPEVSAPAEALAAPRDPNEELIAEISPEPDTQATIRKLPEKRPKEKQKRIKLGPDRVQPSSEQAAPEKPAVEEPIAKGRYEVTFTASAELRDKLERLRALMRSTVPDGDLATVIEAAVTEKLERLESKRYGKTKAPRKSVEEADTSPSSRYIPTPVRRAVYERDQGQCRFVDETGRRCTETRRLEFHHLEPYGQGGDHSLDNVILFCWTHNQYLAERDYGKEVIARYKKSGRSSHRVCEPSAVYHIDWPVVRAS